MAVVRQMVSVSVVAAALATTCVPCVAQPTDRAAEAKISEKALKYHTVLLKRPEPGYVFDRFYNTWLDEASVEDLRTYLAGRVAQTGETADQLLLAYFHAKQGDDVAALEEFGRALASNPASASAWRQKALVEARMLDFESAIADLQKARAAGADDKLKLLIDKELGKLLVRSGKTNEALQLWNALLGAHPQDDELAEDLVELEIDEGMLDQAAELSASLIARTKDPYLLVSRRLRLGDIHHRAGRRDKALEAYSAALEDVGRDSWFEEEILAQTEQIFRREDDLAQLRRHYDELVKKHPQRIALLSRRAQLLIDLGEPDQAVQALRAILELTPGDRARREAFVESLAKMGKQSEAIDEQRALAEQHPQDAELKYRLATLLESAKQTDEAAKVVEAYLAASDKGEYAYLRGARLLERFGRKDDAARIYRQMADAFADSPSAQEAYAAFLYAAERKDEAIVIWRRLASGADVNQALHVARALSARNEHAVALETLTPHVAKFAKEPLFFGQLATIAVALKEPRQAIPWVRRRVELAESASDLEAALEQAALVCERAEALDEVVAELTALQRPTIQQACLLSELLERAGDSVRAEESLAPIIALGEPLGVLQKIRLAAGRRDWGAAAEATRRLLDLPGGEKSVHVRRLVEFYQRDFRLDEALQWIDDWKRLSPGSTAPWLAEATLRDLQGKSAEAVAVLQAAVRQFEGNEELRVRLAQAHVEAGHWGDSERIFWQLYEETEDTSGKLRWAQELAKIAEQQGKVPQLIESFEERRRDNRQSIVPLLALSEIHRTTDNYAGRRQALMAAAQVKPDDLELLSQIARVEEQEGDWKAAVATLERAATLDKTNRTRERIARLHLAFGKPDDGYAILFELAGGPQADPRTLESIADAMAGSGEWERAADFLTQRIVDHAADYRLRYLLAASNEEAGRTREAIAQFLGLLQTPEELPEVAKKKIPTTANPMNSYVDILKKMTPPGVAEWMMSSQFRYQAYAHQQRGGRTIATFMSGGAGGVGAHVQLPAQADQVRPFALAHLMVIGATLDEGAAGDLVRELAARDVDHADVLMRLDPNQQNVQQALAEVLEKNPDDEMALALTVFYGMHSNNDDLSNHGVKALEKFRKSYPELALMAALRAGVAAAREGELAEEAPEEGAKPIAIPLLDEAIALAESLTDPNPMVVQSMATTLAGPPFNQQGAQLPKAYRQKLSRMLIAWRPKLQGTAFGNYGFMIVAAALRQDADPAEFVAFLEEEVAQWRGGKRGVQNQHAMMYGRGSSRGLLEPLTFPPRQLADVPPQVIGLLAPSNDNDPYGFRGGEEIEYDSALAAAAMEKVRDPILRVLLAERFSQKDAIDNMLQELLAEKSPRLDAYLLAAGKASAEERHADALALLAKARFLPVPRDLRTTMDAAIVASAVAAKSAGDASEPTVTAGRDAALRLRQSKLDPNQRSELIAALEDLGLKDEAEKLERIASAQPGVASAAVGNYRLRGMGGRSAAAPDKVAKLVAEGKTEAAVRLLSAELQGQVRQVIANPQNARHFMGYQAREFKQRLEGYGLADETLQALAPGEGANSKRALEHAVALEIFERDDEARQAYERLLEKSPRDDAARIRLIFLLTNSDVSAATSHLKLLGAAAATSIGNMLVQELHDHQSSIQNRIGSAELADAYLKILSQEKKAQIGWSTGVVAALANAMHSQRGSHLPSLYARVAKDSELSGDQLQLQQRRVAVHRGLCERMLASSESARDGFMHWLAATEASGEDETPFVERAKDVLQREAGARRGAQGAVGAMPYAIYRYGRDPHQVRMRSPEEFLVRRAVAANDWTPIDGELLPTLSAGPNQGPAKAVERLAKLYRCAPEEFLSTAENLPRSQARARGQGDQGEELAVVVSAWHDRKLDVDLAPVVLKRLGQIVKGQNHHQPPAFVVDWIDAEARRSGAGGARELLMKISEVYLGPADKWSNFVAKSSPRNGIMWGQPSGRVYVYGQLLQALLERRSLAFVTLPHLQEHEALKSLDAVNNLNHYAVLAVNELVGSTATEQFAGLQSSPWLTDLEQFHPLNLGSPQDAVQEATTWLGNYLHHLGQREELRDEVKSLVAERVAQAPTFGLSLLDAHFRSEDALAEFLTGRLDDLAAIEGPRQACIAALAAQLLPSLHGADLDEPRTQLKAWVDGSLQRGSQHLIDRVRQAKRFEELGVESHETGEFLGGLLKVLVPQDPVAARDVVVEVIRLAEEAEKRQQWYSRYGRDVSTRCAVVADALRHTGDEGLGCLALIAELVGNEQAPIEMGEFDASTVLRKAWDDHAQAVGGGEAPASESLGKFMATLGPSLADRDPSLFLPELVELFGQCMSDDAYLAEALQWAAGEAARDDIAHPLLVRTCHAALALAQSKSGNEAGAPIRPTISANDLAQHEAWLVTQLQNADLTLTWRMCLVRAIVEDNPRPLPAALAQAALDVYLAALDAGSPLATNQSRPMVRWLLGVVHAPELSDRVAGWRNQWAHRYLRPVARAPRGNSASPNVLTDHEQVIDALRVYLQCDDAERVNLIMRHYDGILAHTPLPLACLLRAHKPELAAAFIRAHWRETSITWPDAPEARYDDGLAADMAAMNAQLPRADERAFASALVASMPDPPAPPAENGPEENAGSARDARFAAQAAEFEKVEFQDALLKMRTLVLLSESPAAAELLGESMQVAYAKVNLPVAATDNDGRRWTIESAFALRFLPNELAAGRIQTFVEAFTKLAALAAVDNRRNLAYRLEPFVELYRTSLQNHANHWAPSACADMAKALRSLLEGHEHTYLNYYRKFNTALLLSHVRSEQSEALAEWYAKLGSYKQNHLSQAGLESDLWQTAKLMLGEPSTDNRNARFQFVADVVAGAQSLKLLEWQPGAKHQLRGFEGAVCESCVQADFVTYDEVIAYARESQAAADRPYRLLAVLAEWLRSDEQYADAATLFAAAAAAAPHDLPKERLHWKADGGMALVQQGDLERAEAILQEFATLESEPEAAEARQRLESAIQAARGAAEQSASPPGANANSEPQ